MKNIARILLALAVSVLAAGCIRENLDDCCNLSLSLLYKGDGDTDILAESIDKIDLYVFDQENKLVKQNSYKQDDLGEDNTIPLFRLDPGKYIIVAVGNAYDMTEVQLAQNGDWSNSYIMHPDLEKTGRVDGHDHNYLGYIEVTMASHELLQSPLELKSSHINVSIEMSGLQPEAGVNSRAGGNYQVFFDSSNGKTDFRNKVVEDATGICQPVMEYDEKTGKYVSRDLALFRMDDYCNHVLKVVSPQGNEVLALNLSDYLAQHPEIDVTKQEALLPIEIKFTPVSVEVVVPEWYITDVEPEF